MRKPLLASALIGAGLIVSITGCSAATTSVGEPTSSSSPTPTSSSKPTTPANVGTCVDGNAVVVTSPKGPDVKLAGSCATVSVVGTGGTVELGAVEHLVVEGAKNTITLSSVGVIDFAADANHVTYGGAAPTIHDAGTAGNTATTK